MPELTLGESDYAGAIPDGTTLDAEILSIKHQKKNFVDDEGHEVWKYVFRFAVVDETSPYNGNTVFGETKPTFVNAPGCRLYQWVQEILGRDIPVGFSLNTDDLQTMRCRILIGLRKYENKDGEPQETNFVRRVLRATSFITAAEEPF